MTALALARAEVRRALERCLEGHALVEADALALAEVAGPDLAAMVEVADAVRRAQVGDVVTFVQNRNVNFTNVCVKACRFCAFSRTQRSEQGYFLPTEEIVARAVQARQLGATEVCIQAGLAPGIDGWLYVSLCRAIKAACPDLHIHAFSPEEVQYGAGLAGVGFREYLQALKDAGLGSLPGTSAEILDDAVRARIAPGRISTAAWIEVVTTAHRLGLPTTATMMFGHVESAADRVRHLALLGRLQSETGGFTEIVPLSFVHAEAPMYARKLVPGLRAGPSDEDIVRTHALCRLMLGGSFRNVQVSWVKLGLRQASALLGAGCNDLGGTLMNESISTSAGAAHGQHASPAALRAAIRAAGRLPAERDTRYRLRRTFTDPAADPVDPLDRVGDAEATFGSYRALTQDARFRFALPVRRPSSV